MKPAAQIRPVPSLAEILDDPQRGADLPPSLALEMLAQLAAVQPVLIARALAGGGRGGSDADELLDVNQAAQRLGLGVGWLYRHATKLSFTVRVNRQLRFSARRLEAYIAARANGRPS